MEVDEHILIWEAQTMSYNELLMIIGELTVTNRKLVEEIEKLKKQINAN